MQSSTILIIGLRESRRLANRMSDFGFASRVESTIQAALKRLQTQRFLAILVDCLHTRLDIVELVLNIRDVNAEIPMMLFSARTGTEAQIQALPLPETATPMAFSNIEALAEKLSQNVEHVEREKCAGLENENSLCHDG